MSGPTLREMAAEFWDVEHTWAAGGEKLVALLHRVEQTRLRARAASEDIAARRWAESGNTPMEVMHTKVADVLRDEADRLSTGI